MKRLQSFALYALITPAITLGAGSVLAEKSTDQDANQYGPHPAVESAQRDQDAKQSTSDQGKQRSSQSDSHPAVESAQRDQDAKKPTSRTGQSDQSKQRTSQSDSSHPAVESAQSDKSRIKNRGYLDSTPANGMHAIDLIGAEVTTSGDENVGSVNDLIFDENGQVVAIVISTGGLLGLGEKDVAIGWDYVTRSDNSDGEQELQIDMTREELRSAPKFEMQTPKLEMQN